MPKIEKIVVNCGMGDAEQNSKGLDAAIRDLALITGQRPAKTRAKKSIATFKLREGTTVGAAVTLRGNVRPFSSLFSSFFFSKLLSSFSCFLHVLLGFNFLWFITCSSFHLVQGGYNSVDCLFFLIISIYMHSSIGIVC